MSLSSADKSSYTVHLSSSPKKIVSLVPSITELLYYLELDEEVAGITKFCVRPQKWFRSKRRVGGTKTVKLPLIKLLQPNLIIANKEENVKEQIEQLQQTAPVLVTDITTLQDAIEMIKNIGRLVNKEQRADELADRINAAFEQIKLLNEKINTAYLIWKDPYMAVGGDTFIHNMMRCCGFTNIFQNTNRYPEVSVVDCSVNNTNQSITDNSVNNPVHSSSCQLSTDNCQLSSDNCQLLLLSSEPYPFKQKHINELQTILPRTKIMLVDGEMFSWYGSRLLHSAEYFQNLINQIQQ